MKYLLLSLLLPLSAALAALPFPELRSGDHPAIVPSYVPWKDGEAVFHASGDSAKYGQHQTFFFLNDTTAIMAGHGINDKFDWREINVLGVRPIAFFKYDSYLKRSKDTKDYISWWVYDAAVIVFPEGTGKLLGIEEKDYLSLSEDAFEITAAAKGGNVGILGYVGRTIWGEIPGVIAPFRSGTNTIDKTLNGQLFFTGYDHATKDGANILPAYGTSGGPMIDKASGRVIGLSSWFAEEQETRNALDKAAPKGEKVAVYVRTDSLESRALFHAATHCSELFTDLPKSHCATPSGFGRQNASTQLDYGFEIDLGYIGRGIRVRAKKHGNCAKAFLSKRKSLVIHRVGQTAVQSIAELISHLNASHPNDRSGIVLETETDLGMQKEIFNRSLCMPRVIYGVSLR